MFSSDFILITCIAIAMMCGGGVVLLLAGSKSRRRGGSSKDEAGCRSLGEGWWEAEGWTRRVEGDDDLNRRVIYEQTNPTDPPAPPT